MASASGESWASSCDDRALTRAAAAAAAASGNPAMGVRAGGVLWEEDESEVVGGPGPISPSSGPK